MKKLLAAMGIFQSTSNSHDTTRRDSNDEDDYDDDKDDNIHLEASPEIRVLIIYEQPQGTGLHMNLTLDPRRVTFALKSDLANISGVPADQINLIHHMKKLDDDLSLMDQGIEPGDIIVFRDLRLNYTFP